MTLLPLALAMIVSLSSCANPLSFPQSGPVRSMSSAGQHRHQVFTNPQGPQDNAQPEAIVKGLFDAMPAGVQSDGFKVAKEFLTAKETQSWRPGLKTLIYSGVPFLTRKASVMKPEDTSKDDSIQIEARLQVVGSLDRHGLYESADINETETLQFILMKENGQWRIKNLPQEVLITSTDFQQAFRQVTLYQVASSDKELVPDCRWLSWRDWRVRSVEELLRGGTEWLGSAIVMTNTTATRLTTNGLRAVGGKVFVDLDGAFKRLTASNQSLLVRQIRLTLGDGNGDYDLKISVEGQDDYSDRDRNLALGLKRSDAPSFTLSSDNLISLNSSDPIRVGQNTGFSQATGMVFGTSGGAILRPDNKVECLNVDASSCHLLFDGASVLSITGGLGGEVWGLTGDGALLVSSKGTYRKISIPWISNSHIKGIAVSPEGSRLAFDIDEGPLHGVVVSGLVRDHDQKPVSISEGVTKVSSQNGAGMLTFFDDQVLVYVSQSPEDQIQHAFRQLVPGIETMQKLPPTKVVSLSAGQIALRRSLVCLDETGIVRYVSGSLDGAWTIADSQVTVVSSQ